MNKSLNVFLIVLLCFVLYAGVLTSLYTTDDSASQHYQTEYTSSIPTGIGAPSVSFGVGARGNDLAVPMSSRPSRGVRGGNSFSSPSGVGGRLLLSPYGGAYGSSSLPSLQGGDGGRLITYMSSSQQTKSFGGGSNGNVSMSNGVVSSNTPSSSTSPITSSPTSLIASSPTSLIASSPTSLIASSPYLLPDGTASMPTLRGINGRHNAPGTLGGEDNNYINWLESEGWIYGEGCLTLSEEELRKLYVALTGDSSFQNEDQWNAFWEWFMGKQSDDSFKWKLPLSDAIPFVLLLALVYALYIFVNRKQILTK